MTMYSHDPNDVADYQVDWNTYLEATETIASFTVTAATGLTVKTSPAPSQAAGVVTYWITGGTIGVIYGVTCHIVTSTGREWDHTDQFHVMAH